ncbi:MAG: class SAM-dependent rRNA methyltransferase [Nevskia sp.]|nr:class SAM-dependent rRNA methyltransferase [Nevskia sp.]
MSIAVLRLKPQEERRLRAGHAWVYSNEIDTAQTPLKPLAPGTLVRLEDARGRPLGTAYVNPHALLCARLLTGQPDAVIDADWFVRRLRAAASLRERIYARPFYRLVYGEADGVPGLVIDRYGDVFVVQLGTAGMENLKAPLLAAIEQEFQPRGIVLRNDSPSREAEGLALYVEDIGDVPEQVVIDEGGVAFEIALRGGQKTGWFFDQRDNRDRLARYVKGAPGKVSVLDAFSYVGAWALRALGLGAAEATCIDSSAAALEAATRNAARNGMRIETIKAQALDALKQLASDGRRFDIVIVDPPALIKRKKDHAEGLGLYGRLNRAALNLLTPGGVLVSCSCSHHLEPAELQRVLLRESRAVGHPLVILEQGGQGPDHPVHPAIPETRYLKAFFCATRPQDSGMASTSAQNRSAAEPDLDGSAPPAT